MRFILLAAVALMTLNYCAALQCWGLDLLQEKPCVSLEGKPIDTATCVKKTCSSGQMCKRTTALDTMTGLTALNGCELADEAKCAKATVTPPSVNGVKNTRAVKVEYCFCNDKDFCNGASSGSVSMMTLIVSLSAFLVTMFR